MVLCSIDDRKTAIFVTPNVNAFLFSSRRRGMPVVLRFVAPVPVVAVASAAFTASRGVHELLNRKSARESVRVRHN